MDMNDDTVMGMRAEGENDKLTDWENEPSVLALKEDFTSASSDQSSHITRISTYLDNMNITGSAKKIFQQGKSQVQPKLIRKQAEWRYAALSEPFLSTYDIFNVAPVTAEDQKGAEQNQLVLNYQFNHKINKQKFIDEYIRADVDEGTVILRTGWIFEEKEIKVTEDIWTYIPAGDPNQIQMILQGMVMKENQPAEYLVLPLEMRKSIEYSIKKGGFPFLAQRNGTKKVMKDVIIQNHPTVDVCNYRNITVDPTCEGDLDRAQFVIYSFETSKSELEASGTDYQNLDKIIIGSSSPLSQPDHYASDETSFVFNDEPRKKFVAYEYWGFWDINNDGTVEPFVATWVGNTMIRMERNPFPDRKLPFVSVQYLPVRKEIYGETDGYLLKDNQDVIGAVTRGMIDVMGRSASGQIGIRKDALDVPNKRKYDAGKDYEFNPAVDPRTAIINHTYPEIPNSAGLMLQMQNQDAESLTGVIPFSSGSGGAASLGGSSATAVRGALDAASKRELGILRRLADGLAKVAHKFIAMNSEWLSDEEVVRVTNGTFVPIRRDDLGGHFDLRLTVSTPESDNQKAEELAFMLQTMGPNIDPQLAMTIMADIAKLRKMPMLAEKLENYQPQPDPMAEALQQLEIQKLQAEIAKIQSETQENQANAQLDSAKAQTELAGAGNKQADTDRKNLDYVEQESGVNHEREMQKQSAQAQANTRMKVVEAALKDSEKSTDS